MQLQELLDIEQQKALDKDDVLKMSYRKNLRYLYYDDIKKTDTLKKLLPEASSGLLLLFVMHGGSSKIGHFCLLFRHPRSGTHVFDPYGMGLHKILDITGSNDKLERLIRGHDVHINKHKYQQMHKGDAAINTCGRHCITRWNCAQMKVSEYEDLMHHRGIDPDTIVTLMTLEQDLSKLKMKN